MDHGRERMAYERTLGPIPSTSLFSSQARAERTPDERSPKNLSPDCRNIVRPSWNPIRHINKFVYSFDANCILRCVWGVDLGYFEGVNVLVDARAVTGRGLSGVGLRRRGFDVRAGFHRCRES